MAWIESVFQRETLPALEASLSFSHQRHLTIMNNIANVETPYYKRQSLPEQEFQGALKTAIDERQRLHPDRFVMRNTRSIRFAENHYPVTQRDLGQDWGPERHDENNVVIEKEMADLAKNALYMQTLQQLTRKKLNMLSSSLRDRVA